MTLYELVFIVRQEVSPIRAKELAKKINDFAISTLGTTKKYLISFIFMFFFKTGKTWNNVNQK